MKYQLVLGLALISSITGCSSGGGDGGGGGVQGKLSAEQEAALQAWIQAPIKSCQAIEVVGGGASTSSDDFGIPGFPSAPAPRPSNRDAIEKGVDLSVLHAKTKGSMWIGSKSASGAFAVLSGGASGFTSGVQTSKFEQTVEINGSSQSVKVETESSGYDCLVKVNGVERARLQIAKEVEIGLAGDLAELSSPSSFPAARIATSFYSNRGFIKYDPRAARFDSGNISDLLFKSMKSETAREAALKGLGFSPEQIRKHFVMGAGVRPHQLALDLSHIASGGQLTLAARSGFILTETSVDAIPTDGQAKDLKFAVLLATEKAQVGPKEFNSGAPKVMAITRQLRMENRAGEFVVKDSGLGSISEKAAGAQVAEKCALDRAVAANFLYFQERFIRTTAPIASRAEIYGPCAAYDRDAIELAEKSGTMLTTLNALYRSIPRGDFRGSRFSFGDWSQSVSYYLVKGLQSGSTDRLVEPRVVATPAMMILDQMMLDVRLEVNGAALSQDYRGLLADLVIGLSESQLSDSADSASSSFARGMARTAVRAGSGFETSFGGLVRIAIQDWRRAGSMVSWADSMMTASYLVTARAVSSEASLIGYRPYFDEVHSRLFEVQPTESDLASQLDRFRGFRTQLDRFPQLKPVADVLSTSLLKSRVQPVDYPRTIEAAAKLAAGDADLVAVYMNALKTGDGVTEFDAIRTWALALTTSDQQAIASVLANGKAMGIESESRHKLRDAVSARVGSSVLQSMANAGGLAKAFIAAEAGRASGSTRDTFYESKAKEIAKRIFLQNFSATDVQALETFAKVAGADLMCEGRQTISSRLDCAGLQRFTKEGDGLLNDRYQGRYVSLATRMQVWFGQLVPANDHLSMRRKLKSALFPAFNNTPWATCDAQSYQVKFQALDKAVGAYLVAIGDFVTRSQAERDVQTAMDARCP
ncbi:MAG: hypothetical protein J0L82_16905 [Deltaproteobacteria bacterium]|nr:hypothetical protein [Deltaproteobacteria bacterium]